MSTKRANRNILTSLYCKKAEIGSGFNSCRVLANDFCAPSCLCWPVLQLQNTIFIFEFVWHWTIKFTARITTRDTSVNRTVAPFPYNCFALPSFSRVSLNQHIQPHNNDSCIRKCPIMSDMPLQPSSTAQPCHQRSTQLIFVNFQLTSFANTYYSLQFHLVFFALSPFALLMRTPPLSHRKESSAHLVLTVVFKTNIFSRNGCLPAIAGSITCHGIRRHCCSIKADFATHS